MGYYNDVEGMQFNVIEPTIVDSRTRKQAAAWFKAPDSGIYYLGIHGISTRSGANSDYLFIDNIQIEAASTGLEPEHVTDVAFVNDPAGTPELDITLKMPTTTVDGSALTGTVDLIVKRGDVADRTLVTTITGKQPGETINFKDNPGVDGIADYTFITRNSAGDGGEYTVRHFAGFVAPEVPVITSMEEIDVNRIQMKWDAPKRDLNGNALNADAFLYNIYDYSTDVVLDLEKDYAETVYTMDVAPMYNGQNATFMIVTATLNGNESGLLLPVSWLQVHLTVCHIPTRLPTLLPKEMSSFTILMKAFIGD